MDSPTTNKKKKKVSSNSSYIPDDISFMILCKLPVKSLKRFSCVRKSWSLLFENHDFFEMFRNNVISKSHPHYDDACQILTQNEEYNWNIYLLSGDKFENKVKLDFPTSLFPVPTPQYTFGPFSVLGSAINGILCIFHKNDTLLWNPATEEIKIIPPGFAEFGYDHDLYTFINRCGFGYDHVTHDFKIIQHVGYIGIRTQLNPFWEIYSLKSNSWRKIDFDMPTVSWLSKNVVYLDGVCHWWGLSNKLMSFNLCNEMCFITPLFLDFPNDFDVVNLNVLNGCVAIITSRMDSTSFQISILGELGVKESWIKLFDVERMSCNIYPIGIGKKGNIFFQSKDNELTCLDLTTGLVKETGLKGTKFSCHCQVVIYKRNLHPIGEINN